MNSTCVFDLNRGIWECPPHPWFEWIVLALLLGLVYIAIVSRKYHEAEWEEKYWIHELLEGNREIRFLLHRIIGLIEGQVHEVTGFRISQGVGMITGVQIGNPAGGTFAATPTPAGSALPSGNVPVWTASDPSVGLTQAADGLSVVAVVPAGLTLTTFDLTITAQPLPDGTSPAATASIPVLAATVPTVTGFTIDQTA